MKKTFLLSITILVILFSCDRIDNPIPEPLGPCDETNWDDSLNVKSNPTMRKILIEEFTGHLCTVCPLGAKEIERLDSIYGEQLIPMSIHAGSFAVALTGADFNGDLVDDFTTDFTNPSGETYFTTFGVSVNPASAISRINNANISGLSQWASDIASISGDAPKVSIDLTVLYNETTRTVKSVVNTEWLSSETGNFNIQLYLVEDSIVDWQVDNSVYVQFYTHRHVFREVINGTWGTSIPSSNSGDTDSQEYCLTLPENWEEKNCIVIAHVYNANTYEVLQVEELHIKE